MSDADGLEPVFLAAEEGGRLVGALGLFLADHPVFGRYLATAAHGNDGGFFHDDDRVRDALLDAARAESERRAAAYLLIRARDPLPGFTADERYRAAVVGLEGGPSALWDGGLDSKTRNQVRRGQKEGFSVAVGPEQMPAFYEVFHEHMRDLGSPAHGRSFYASVLSRLGERAEFLVVRDGAVPVAGALVFTVNGVASNYHTVALRRYNPRCPNYLLYWTMLERACVAGCARFDMGRSEAGGPNMAFKLNWGAREVPLFYNYLVKGGGEPPRLDPRALRFRAPVAVWKRLPVVVTKALGPKLMPGIL